MAAPGRPRLHREHSGMLPHHQFKAALAESASASPRRKKPAKKQHPPMLGQLKRQPSLFSSSSQLLASAVHEVQP
ncbi:hypothetical protein JL722_2287 [Aureococcus anophagefferens]|nr:hypothetical protein JL722_2287 [Aureococcus anophagefferens]